MRFITVVLIYIYVVLHVYGFASVAGSPEDATHCKIAIDQRLKVFEVLPGMGWDNLQNTEMGQIAVFQFTGCHITNDGDFLIPDQVQVIPLKESKIDQYAEVLETMQDYVSKTSKTVNTATSIHLPFVSASFSSEYQKTKMRKMEQRGKTSTFRVQARYLRYRSILQQGISFHPDFKKRLFQIAEYIILGNKKMAYYMSQLIIRDYGTHIIISSDAGGLIAKEDEVSFSSEEDVEKETHSYRETAAIHFSFLFGLIKAGAEHEQSSSSSTENMNSYLDKVQNSDITTHGGPNYRFQNFSIRDWVSRLDNNLVALDRKGEPLHNLITEINLMELPESIIPELKDTIKRAIEIYYKRNTYYGCTDMKSDKFNAKANVDDNSCRPSKTNSPFGGVYQVCTMLQSDNGYLCDFKTAINLLTGKVTCPEGFKTLQIHEDTIETVRTEKRCKRSWFRRKCHDVQYRSSATIKAFWCSLQSSSTDIPYYRFGGMYSEFYENPLTNAKSCPSGYASTVFADDITVCVTSDVTTMDLGSTFGGMFSCRYGNEMAGGNKRCPDGFSQHLISSDKDCDLMVCLQYENMFGINQTLPTLKRPPFMMKPPISKPLEANTVLIDDNRTWFKDEKAYEKMTELDQTENQDTMAVFSNTLLNVQRLVNISQSYFSLSPAVQNGSSTIEGQDKMSRTSVVIISSATTSVCMLTAYLVLFLVKQRL